MEDIRMFIDQGSCDKGEQEPEWHLSCRSDESFLVADFIMIAKYSDHGIHGLFPCDVSSGWFPVSLAVSGLFFTDLTMVGGVHAPHNMVLAPMERLALSAKTGVLFFCVCLG